MDLIVNEDHLGEGQFPLFLKGTQVQQIKACEHFQNWVACQIEGYQTYAPVDFIQNNQLLIDYDPTELIVEAGMIVKLLEAYYEWAYVVSSSGIEGWVPFAKLRTLNWELI